ncbi:hypothetical protein BGX34_002215 [Mortierella sp. NVP85]|nr:hypothetical protein BGX34_002215 [Mortierella sp. NVP85]
MYMDLTLALSEQITGSMGAFARIIAKLNGFTRLSQSVYAALPKGYRHRSGRRSRYRRPQIRTLDLFQ